LPPSNRAPCRRPPSIKHTTLEPYRPQFANNLGTSYGGAIYYSHESNHKTGLAISGTSFINNKAGHGGGAIYHYKPSTKAAKLLVTNCVFNGNEAAEHGSAIMTSRSDTENNKPGTPLMLVITSSTFTSACCLHHQGERGCFVGGVRECTDVQWIITASSSSAAPA